MYHRWVPFVEAQRWITLVSPMYWSILDIRFVLMQRFALVQLSIASQWWVFQASWLGGQVSWKWNAAAFAGYFCINGASSWIKWYDFGMKCVEVNDVWGGVRGLMFVTSGERKWFRWPHVAPWLTVGLSMGRATGRFWCDMVWSAPVNGFSTSTKGQESGVSKDWQKSAGSIGF